MSVSQSTEATVEETADNLSPTSNNPDDDDDQEKQEPVEKTEIQAETGTNGSGCSSPTLAPEQNENQEKEKSDLLDNATMAQPNENSPENGNIDGEVQAIPVSGLDKIFN
jgi:hypothetical protein